MSLRRHLPMLVVCVLLTPSLLHGQKSEEQKPVGLQGTLGIGGGDKLGFTGVATLGPRIGGNLISVRATWGAGVADPDLGLKKTSITELGLMYGRRFCSPGACYSFGFGPGVVNQVILNPISNIAKRENHLSLMYQITIGGTVTPTTTLGLTIMGNRNAGQNIWALLAGVQFGMPRQHSASEDDE